MRSLLPEEQIQGMDSHLQIFSTAVLLELVTNLSTERSSLAFEMSGQMFYINAEKI